jgi:large subunit ribosomal protein L25
MKFVAFERSKQGTGASRRLRNSGKAPGIVYGGEGMEPKLVEIDHNALWHALKKEAFHASILDMEIGEATSKVLLRDVQYHPYKQQVLHVDFQRVDAKTRLHMKVPLHFKGQEESPAVKTHANLISHTMTELEVACFPGDLPEFIEVDLSTMDNAGTVTVKDIKFPKGVKFVVHGNKMNPVVASAMAPVAEEEIVAPVAAPAEETKGKGKKK